MKLASIRYRGRDIVAAEIAPGELVGVATIPGRPPQAPIHMIDIIRGGEPLRERLAETLNQIRNDESVARIAIADVSWHPPVPWPSKVCAVATGRSAGNERDAGSPHELTFVAQPSSCLVGHREPIRARPYYGSAHPEPGLAVVIGRITRDIRAIHALDSVYGYSIYNCIASDDARAAGADTFGVMGPWLVTKDEIANPDDLAVRCKVGADVAAGGGTRHYPFKVAEVVSFVSHFQTLLPGDVIALGAAFAPGEEGESIRRVDLQTASGPIEIVIDGLGTQESPILLEQKELGAWRLG